MTARVMFVDDEPSMLKYFSVALSSSGHELESCLDPRAALEAIHTRGPFAVVLSDMHMPEMTGVQFLAHVRERSPETVRMLITGAPDLTVAIDAVNEGQVFRFLTKPTSIDVLRKTVAAGVEQHNLLTHQKDLLESTLAGSIQALSEVLTAIDPATFGRTSRIRRLAQKLGAELNVEDPWQLEVAASLSQIGCVSVPDAILAKAFYGGALTAEERRRFESHAEFGRTLIGHIPRLENVGKAVAYQQKHFDGGGFPTDNIRGTHIPLLARILKVAIDCDTLETAGLSRAAASKELKSRTGWYDPAVLEALAAIAGKQDAFEEIEISPEELLKRIRGAHAPRHGAMAPAQELPEHLTLAADVISSDGALILRKGFEITVPLLHKLQSHVDSRGVHGAIRITVKKATE